MKVLPNYLNDERGHVWSLTNSTLETSDQQPETETSLHDPLLHSPQPQIQPSHPIAGYREDNRDLCPSEYSTLAFHTDHKILLYRHIESRCLPR